MSQMINVCWFRRDLRLTDNAALYHALRADLPVLCVFIFDTNILDKLENKHDRRVEFIYNAIESMQSILKKHGSSMRVFHATPLDAFTELLKEYQVKTVFTNNDYEAYAIDRDKKIQSLLGKNGGKLESFKDQVIFEKSEVVKDDGKPYTVYTPYSKRWKATVNDFYLSSYPTEHYFKNFLTLKPLAVPSLKSMGFAATGEPFPSPDPSPQLIRKYDKQRDYPAIDGTSRIGIHLRFGTVSIRKLAREATELNATYLNELIWRDFYQMILWQFPHVGRGHAFRPEYDRIKWRNNEEEFERWCSGTTGFPIVDAGMRQLNEMGFMHNRVRMITASFLTKDLLIDWRWGEAYFAEKLLDYDLAANNGGWQWAAGSGCDAAPYFRVFNPTRQAETFDKDLKYIRKWVPELDSFKYPQPMVDHAAARERCLAAYKVALDERKS